ncbi:Neural Wiskott-Aldrich syndrome protein-like [Oopsacas minuta]|uniref:Neural Wiskott-Aldrich syndrome protein-like n=1 Tax=Oopsacas minuta TaxID=111878 RepID=A0AAV7K4T1_9METZ|nr:Neural Wiskott-Aldrich syndrome protein-like [Oopsacas minuta]
MSQQRNKPKDTNQSSKLLSLAENNTVFEILGQRRITKATAVVQIYFANQSPSQWAKQHTSILCFVKDNVKRSYYLRMVDINGRTILWEHELYYQISYMQDRKQFQSFAG